MEGRTTATAPRQPQPYGLARTGLGTADVPVSLIGGDNNLAPEYRCRSVEVVEFSTESEG